MRLINFHIIIVIIIVPSLETADSGLRMDDTNATFLLAEVSASESHSILAEPLLTLINNNL